MSLLAPPGRRPRPVQRERSLFFWADNPEIVVKVLDARFLGRSFWVIAAPLTTLDWELEITDTGSGRVRTYRPSAAGLRGVADLRAFVDSAHAPRAPLITEPDIDGRRISVADVHMETAPFSDPDPEDEHYCLDFEIWQMAGEPPRPFDRVWHAECVVGRSRPTSISVTVTSPAVAWTRTTSSRVLTC